MRIIDPQSAVLSNVEVLAYLTTNPPRQPPKAPPNSRHWVPSPDLRDHNTVVKEIHNYMTRLSPHVLTYPAYTTESQQQQLQQQQRHNSTSNTTTNPDPTPIRPIDNTPTPLDHALRSLVERLQPYGLTKGEVLMILNLGVGVTTPAAAGEGEDQEGGEGEGEYAEEQQYENGVAEGEETAVNGHGNGVEAMEVDAEGGGEGGEGEGQPEEVPEEDYGAMALLDTVIEEREERLTEENVMDILAIIRETLGGQVPTQEA